MVGWLVASFITTIFQILYIENGIPKKINHELISFFKVHTNEYVCRFYRRFFYLFFFNHNFHVNYRIFQWNFPLHTNLLTLFFHLLLLIQVFFANQISGFFFLIIFISKEKCRQFCCRETIYLRVNTEVHCFRVQSVVKWNRKQKQKKKIYYSKKLFTLYWNILNILFFLFVLVFLFLFLFLFFFIFFFFFFL